MKTPILTLVLLCALGIPTLKAQVPYTSLFFNSPIELNPAFTGIEGLSRVSLSTKDLRISTTN